MSVHYQASTKVGRYAVAIWNHEVGNDYTGRGGTEEVHGFGYHVDVCAQKECKVVAVFGAYDTDIEVKAAFDAIVRLIAAGRGFDWTKA